LLLITPQPRGEIREMLAGAADGLLWAIARVSSEVGLDDTGEPIRALIGVVAVNDQARRRRRR